MGYYSSIELDVRIPKDKIEAFNKKAEELEKVEGDNWFGYYESLRADENGELDYTDTDFYRKHYDSEKLACLVFEFGGRGEIKFYGEDNERWGFSFMDDGIYELSCEWVRTTDRMVIENV